MSGCGPRRGQLPPAGAPVIPVSKPVQRQVTDFVDFTGQTSAVNAVNIVARVTGYIDEIPFTEGAEVNKDAVLFKLDPRPYKAQVELAEAQVALNEAQMAFTKKVFERDLELIKKNGVSQQEFEQDRAAAETAAAQLKAAQANLATAKLNLGFTEVKAPIKGKTSIHYWHVGDLVNQNQTLLTTIKSLDPIYVFFDIDEPTLLKIKKAVNEGRMKSLQEGGDEVYLALQAEGKYSYKGKIDFVNNQFNPTTGGISVRGVFPNKKLPKQGRPLLPGMFVRVRLPIGVPYDALLVIDRAIFTLDQKVKKVYVLDGDNKVQSRTVTTGPLQEDGLRVITAGLHADDRVVVGGLQQIGPGTAVEPEPIAMPTLNATKSGADSPAPKSPGPPTGKGQK